MKNTFKIKTIQSSGLGDQLGTQFMRLHEMGLALDWDFAWDPIYFPRSIKPDWYERRQKCYFFIRYWLLKIFRRGSNRVASGINALLLKLEKRDDLKLSLSKDDLSDFLNLKALSSIDGDNLPSVDVYLSAFIKENEVFTKEGLRLFITEQSQGKNPCLCWDSEMWGLIPFIDRFLLNEKVKGIGDRKLREAYCDKQGYKDSGTVIHIRCGDSTTVHLPNTDLIIYDKFLYTSENQMSDIFKIDPHRRSILPSEFVKRYSLIKHFGEQITVISDGFDITYRNIFRNLLKRKCPVRLSKTDLQSLLSQAKCRNDVFKEFAEADLVIGESETLLKESIRKISNAGKIIWGVGGFALTIQKLFGQNSECEIYNINDL